MIQDIEYYSSSYCFNAAICTFQDFGNISNLQVTQPIATVSSFRGPRTWELTWAQFKDFSNKKN